MGGSIKKAQVGHVIISVAKTLQQKEMNLATIAITKSRIGKDGVVFENCKFNNELLEIDTETAAWQRSAGKDPEGGLNRKGIASYRAANPGSKLSMAVTTKPSKLKPGSKAANRRKSFCARMGGMKKRLTSAKTARDPDSRINKALRRWNCN